ncbi:MAG: trigger factor [bacterium]
MDNTVKAASKESVEKKQENSLISFLVKPISSRFAVIIITVDPELVTIVYRETIELFRKKIFSGFKKETVPAEYIEENFETEIQNNVKDYLLRYTVIKYLFDQIIIRKIHLSNYPRLKKIEISPDKSIRYSFNISLVDPLELKEWKHFSFKSPKRKKYKDLDKQVIAFVNKESIPERKLNVDTVEENDWICFNAMLTGRDGRVLEKEIAGDFWMRIKKQEILDPYQNVFLGKKLYQSFYTDCLAIRDEPFNEYDNYRYNFLVTIKALVKGTYMSLESLKNYFKLKNKTEIHNKLMEVFSYRDDISQRKSIIEELFHLFLSKHRFEVPKHLVLRRQEDILESIMEQPDFQVYKAQKDFESCIEMLAEKQLKEEILIDKIAYQESIKVDLRDVQYYLHLFNNRRLREFVYFKPLIEKIDSVNTALHASILKQTVLREKTLNSVIHSLTR